MLAVSGLIVISCARWVILNGVQDYKALVFIGVLLLIPCWLGRIGLDIFFGRCEITLSHDQLVGTKRIGPWWRHRRRRLSDVTRFNVVSRTPEADDAVKLESGAGWAGLAALEAIGPDIEPLKLASGYPSAWMTALAEALSSHAANAGASRTYLDEAGLTVARDVPVDAGVELPRVPEQPASSLIQLIHRNDGLSLKIPPLGIWSVSRTQLLIAGFFLFGTISMSISWIATGQPTSSSHISATESALAITIFGLSGSILALNAIKKAYQHAVIDIVHTPPDSVLLITHKTLLKTRQTEMQREKIVSIKVGTARLTDDDDSTKELQIKTKDAKTICLFAGRSKHELHWLAIVLRNALSLLPEEADRESNSRPVIDSAPSSNDSGRRA